jgi:hypothetical protein
MAALFLKLSGTGYRCTSDMLISLAVILLLHQEGKVADETMATPNPHLIASKLSRVRAKSSMTTLSNWCK